MKFKPFAIARFLILSITVSVLMDMGGFEETSQLGILFAFGLCMSFVDPCVVPKEENQDDSKV